MQVFSTWPDKAKLNLPEAVNQAILNHLTEPFQSLSEAKAYWLAYGIKLIMSAVPDDVTPEYTDPLPNGFLN